MCKLSEISRHLAGISCLLPCGTRDPIQVLWLGSKHVYLLNHLTGSPGKQNSWAWCLLPVIMALRKLKQGD